MQGDHLETWHVFPTGDGVNECEMYVSLYPPDAVTSDKARKYWDKNFKLLLDTVEEEDFPLAEAMQRSFHTSAQRNLVFGRNEPALAHFHGAVSRHVGEPVV